MKEKIFAFIGLFFLSLVYSACSTTHLKQWNKVNQSFESLDFASVEKEVLFSPIIEEEKNRLLILLELATNAHYEGLYGKSLIYFEIAKSLVDDLYTKSISEEIKSNISNDNTITYSGLPYEQSFIYYYLILNHLLIAEDGNTKAFLLPRLAIDKKIIIESKTVPS